MGPLDGFTVQELDRALDDDLHGQGVYGRPGRIPTSRCVPCYSLIDPAPNRLVDIATAS